MKEIIATPDAPSALGPYSQGVEANDMVFVSGQLPLDPRTGKIISDSCAAQTEQCLLNIRAIVEQAELALNDIVKLTVYMTDLGEFDQLNETFTMFFPDNADSLPPARATVEVSRLPKNAKVEIDAIAVRSGKYVDEGYQY